MKNLTAIEKLDSLLNYFCDEKSRGVTFTDISKKFKIDDGLIREILDRLLTDGHVREFVRTRKTGSAWNTYSITFNGRTFHEVGGYKQQQKEKHILTWNKRIQNTLLIGGTAAAGAYGIFEILKWVFHHEHWKIPF